jgi:transcription elongation GreA/GreB family factor
MVGARPSELSAKTKRILARALIGKAAGDVVSVGDREIEVLSIE